MALHLELGTFHRLTRAANSGANRFSRTGSLSLVEKRLQNERGGHLVYHLPMLLARMAGFIQNLVGIPRGQALVPQVDGQPAQFAQLRGKCLRLGGLCAGLAGEMHRIADDDPRNAESPRQPRQAAQIVSAVAIPLQSHHRLSRYSQFV